MKIFVKVKPKARENKIEKIDPPTPRLRWAGENHFVVWVKEAPEKGRANAAVSKLLAEHFKIAVSSVKLISGQTSKNKIFEIPIL